MDAKRMSLEREFALRQKPTTMLKEQLVKALLAIPERYDKIELFIWTSEQPGRDRLVRVEGVKLADIGGGPCIVILPKDRVVVAPAAEAAE